MLLVLAAPTVATAQRNPAVRVELGANGHPGDGPTVSMSHVLDDPQIEDLLKHGFPVAMHFRLELWRTGGVFNDLERTTRWDVRVLYNPDPYAKAYHIVRQHGNRTEDFGSVPTLDSADALLARPYRVNLAPSHANARYYYNVVLDVESLNVNDLSELQRWLNGDLQPAVRGHTNPLSALKNGIGALLSRVLGGAKRSFEATSPTFVAGGS
ncbi:MAG: hypothetical protein ACRENQ_05935 [Gemmatimonadaceae bacterium]